MIIERDGKFYVESEGGKPLGGPYENREQADFRLKQVEYFKNQRPKKKKSLFDQPYQGKK